MVECATGVIPEWKIGPILPKDELQVHYFKTQDVSSCQEDAE